MSDSLDGRNVVDLLTYAWVQVQEAHLPLDHHLVHRVHTRSIVVPTVSAIFYKPFKNRQVV